MPILDYILLVLGLMPYLQETISVLAHSRMQHSLKDIILNQSYTHRQKRPSRMGGQMEFTSECCPSVTRPIAPLGGISKEGHLLQLFRDQSVVQKFYETECQPGVRDRECAFVDNTSWRSRCRQRYTYTYAIVKNFNITEPYRIDYMKIKSGCTCTIIGPADERTNADLAEELLAEIKNEMILEGN